MKFPFRLDRERAYAAWGAQARSPAVAAKYNNPDDRANQRPYGGHEKVGAPKLPAKGRQGLIFASSNKDASDGNDIVHGGAKKPAVRQASAATKDGHGVRTVRADEDDPDDDESASTGARYRHGSEPWRLRPSSTTGSVGPLARPRAGTATRLQAAVRRLGRQRQCARGRQKTDVALNLGGHYRPEQGRREVRRRRRGDLPGQWHRGSSKICPRSQGAHAE